MKARLDNQPGNNNNQLGNNEVCPKFDKLYSAIRQGEKLDGHISAACKILWKQFPNIQGLHTPFLSQNFSFSLVNSLFLLAGYQILTQVLMITELQ